MDGPSGCDDCLALSGGGGAGDWFVMGVYSRCGAKPVIGFG